MPENENLEALGRFIAELEAHKLDPRVPKLPAGSNTPSTLLNENGVPIVLHGAPVDFAHLVEVSQVVHPETIEVETLQTIVDWFANEADWADGFFIRISSPCGVGVQSHSVSADGARDHVLRAVWKMPTSGLGQWLPIPEFSTWLLSHFVPNKDSQALYATIGRGVRYEAAREASDGSGSVELKTSEGIRVLWEGVGPHFNLAYICTFPEIEQPERRCVFRTKNTDDGIMVTLVDADGGAWRQKAIALIHTWLKGHDELQDVVILG